MTNKRRILGILWYEFVTNVEVATLSQLTSINEAISRRRHSLWPRQAYEQPYISQSRHDRAQDSLTPGGDNQVVREDAGSKQVTTSIRLSPSDAWSVATDRSA